MNGWEKPTRFIAIDTETTGLVPRKGDRPFLVSMHNEHGQNIMYRWAVNPFTRSVKVRKRDKEEIKRLCKNKHLVFFNAIFDISMLESIGLKLDWRNNFTDVSILSHAVHSGIHSALKGRLKPLALQYLDYDDDDEQELAKSVNLARNRSKKLHWELATTGRSPNKRDYWMPREIARHHPELLPEVDGWIEGDDPTDHRWWNCCERYASSDTERTILLFLLFRRILDRGEYKAVRYLVQREHKLLEVIYDMENKGMTLFPERVQSEIELYESTTQHCISTMRKMFMDPEFNPNSNEKVAQALLDLGFLLKDKTPTGKWRVDKHVIKCLKDQSDILTEPQNEFLDVLIEYNDTITVQKYATRYEADRIGNVYYYSFNSTGTSTTRCSSNLHNVAKGKETETDEPPKYNLRKLFGPEKGRQWFCIDYSQLQLRIFAYVSGEQSLIKALEDGYDLHTYVAMRIFNKEADEISKLERRIAKNVNFGFIFGAQPKKIEQTAGKPGLWDVVTRLFPHAHDFMNKTKAMVRCSGFVTTPTGYRLYLPTINNRPMDHAGVNYIVQGCEGDIVKQAMINTHEYLSESGVDAFLRFQIHDELIFDFPRKVNRKKLKKMIRDITDLMEQPAKDLGMVCPVDVEYTTQTWADVKPWKG